VLVPEWPENKMMYRSTLLSLPYFDTPSISHEDRERTKMYVTERQRETLKRKAGSLDEWLKTLHMKVRVEELDETNVQRAAQLLNKTNQMNLSKRSVIDIELVDWAKPKNRKLWTFRVSDRFGDSGVTGIISLESKQRTGQIIDFALSCRVMGRKIEEAMLYTVLTYARSIQLNEVYAQYVPTSKNQPCLAFWGQSGFHCDKGENRFTWQVKCPYELPDVIQIEWGSLSTLRNLEIPTAELGAYS